MKYNILFISFAASLCLFSCQGNSLSLLSQVESYINDRPDSARAVLEAMDVRNLRSDRAKAKHALLYSMALDKNYIDLENDSIINVAVRYYRDKGTTRDRMLSYYYLGRIQQNCGNYTGSIISFTNALDNAECTNDLFYKGLIYRGLADISGLTYNRKEKLRYRQLEYESFVEAGAERHADFAMKQLGSSYAAIHDFENSRICYDKVINLAKEKQDTSLLVESLLDFAHMLTVKDRPEPAYALEIYSFVQDTLKRKMSLYDMITMSAAYRQSGMDELAGKTIDKIKPYIGEDRTLLALTSLNEYYIAKDIGLYEDAVKYIDEFTMLQDSLYYLAFDNSIMGAQRDYIHQQLEHEKYKSRSSMTILILIIVSLLLLMSVLGYGFYRYRQKTNCEIVNNLNMQEEARCHLQQNKETISGFSQQIGQLYRTKLELIGGICERFYEHENISNRQKFVYREVESVIDKLTADEESPLLENTLNEYRDGIMLKLRNDPALKLKPDDLRLLAYWFAGFPPTVMSLLLGKDIDVIYNMRSRIRARIRNSDSKYKDLYLMSMLND